MRLPSGRLFFFARQTLLCGLIFLPSWIFAQDLSYSASSPAGLSPATPAADLLPKRIEDYFKGGPAPTTRELSEAMAEIDRNPPALPFTEIRQRQSLATLLLDAGSAGDALTQLRLSGALISSNANPTWLGLAIRNHQLTVESYLQAADYRGALQAQDSLLALIYPGDARALHETRQLTREIARTLESEQPNSEPLLVGARFRAVFQGMALNSPFDTPSLLAYLAWRESLAGRLGLANRYYRQGLEHLSKNPERAFYAQLALGLNELNLGYQEKGAESLAEALNLFLKSGLIDPQNGNLLVLELARVQLSLGNPAQAGWYLQSLQPATLGLWHRVSYLGLMSRWYRQNHDAYAAEIFLARAFETAGQAENPPLRLQAELLRLRAEFALQNGHPREALGDLENAAAVLIHTGALRSGEFPGNAAWLSDPEGYVTILGEIAALQRRLTLMAAEPAERQLWLKSALATVTSGIRAVEAWRSDLEKTSASLRFSKAAHRFYEAGIETALLAARELKDPSFKEQAFTYSESSRAHLLARSLAETEALDFAGIPDRLLRLERGLRENLSYYNSRLQLNIAGENAPSPSRFAADLQAFQDNQQRYQELISHFERDYPAYYELKFRPHLLTVRQIQEKLAEKEGLLTFFMGEAHQTAFLITRDGFQPFPLAENSNWKAMVRDYYCYLRDPFTYSASASLGEGLYDWLLSPLAGRLTDLEVLQIVPDDLLAYLPFEALRSPQTGRYLVEDLSVLYHFSGFLGVRGPAKTKAGKLSFGGYAPGFLAGKVLPPAGDGGDTWQQFWGASRSGSRDFAPLPFSQTEVRRIAAAFQRQGKSGQVFLNAAASEQSFKERAPDFRILHLATHSFDEEESPGLAGIAFHDAANGGSAFEDGILFSGEIYNLKLNADLVVLSSCESGLGQLIEGEGMMGMTRAFLYAGVSNVAVSLWKVQDRFTSGFMVSFYEKVLAGMDYQQALRATKLAFLRDHPGLPPGFWSSFVLFGPLQASSH